MKKPSFLLLVIVFGFFFNLDAQTIQASKHQTLHEWWTSPEIQTPLLSEVKNKIISLTKTLPTTDWCVAYNHPQNLYPESKKQYRNIEHVEKTLKKSREHSLDEIIEIASTVPLYCKSGNIETGIVECYVDAAGIYVFLLMGKQSNVFTMKVETTCIGSNPRTAFPAVECIVDNWQVEVGKETSLIMRFDSSSYDSGFIYSGTRSVHNNPLSVSFYGYPEHSVFGIHNEYIKQSSYILEMRKKRDYIVMEKEFLTKLSGLR